MLSAPEHGWSIIQIGDWSDKCCNRDDVPFALLEALTNVCQSNHPAAIHFHTTGNEYTIVFDFEMTHIISQTHGGYALASVNAYCYELATELVADIYTHIDAWVNWIPELQNTELLVKRKIAIEAACSELQELAAFYML